MKVTHGAITLASAEQRVGLCALRHPAELALPVGFLSVSLCVWNFLVCLSIQLLRELRPGTHLGHVDVDRLKRLILVFGGAV